MELEEILQMAQEDSDQWVAMVGDILKTYPSAGTLNTDVEHRHSFYHEVVADLRKLGNTYYYVLHIVLFHVFCCHWPVDSQALNI